MALLFCEGFDWNTGAAGDLDLELNSKYGITANDTAQASTVSTPFGEGKVCNFRCFVGGPGNSTTDNTIIVGWHGRLGTGTPDITPDSDADCFIRIRDNGANSSKISITFGSGNVLVIRRGSFGGTIIHTSTYAPPLDLVWRHYEVKVVYNATTGSVIVRENGVEKINQGSLNTGTPTITTDGVSIAQGGLSSSKIDNVYMCDGTGSVNNDFLGEKKVQTIVPDGDTSQEDWALSTGTNSYALIDDFSDEDSTYISSGTTTDKTRVTMGAISTGAVNIAGLVQTTKHKRDDATAVDMRTNLKSGATTNNGATVSMTASYTCSQEVYETDPNTGSAWTAANVNLVESEFEIM
jgi:hypothetical protein